MINSKSESEFEKDRLEQTIDLAKRQLNQARQDNEENKSAIITAKKELRENTSHSISGLWSAEGFEALAELSQYANPVTDKIIDYEEVENKILLLENLIKSPYFARIDFKFEGEDQYEKIYIGRTSLKTDSSYEMSVYDWRSPIASVFYRFVTGQVYYDAPGGRITGAVNLKRQYEISNSVLEYFFDADVQIVDEFLKKLLSKNTSSKMKTIVETIQKDQDMVIRDMENDLMMVQGVAGSGKTSIALHRAAYLMYQGLGTKLSANNIIIISPNALFEQYISNVLPELGEHHVVSVVFEEILITQLKNVQSLDGGRRSLRIQTRNQFLENLITGEGCRKVLKSSIEFKTSHLFRELLNLLIQDLPLRWIDFEDIYYEGTCIVSKEILRKKILGRIETPIGIKLKQLEEFILELMRDAKKERLSKVEMTLAKEEMQKFTELHVLDLYKKMFSNKQYFYFLLEEASMKCGLKNDSAHGDGFKDVIENIIEVTRDNLNADVISYDDAAVLAYLNIKIYGADEYKNMKQVVIDEAQDYYPLQFEIFHLLFPNSKFTILGDMNQTLEKQEDLSLYEQIGKTLNKRKSSLITMDKSFRCTNEILNYSLKFIGQHPEIKSFNRTGDEPQVHTAADRDNLCELICGEIDACKALGYGSVGLICKSEKNALALFTCLKEITDVQLIKNDSNSDVRGVFIIPVYMSKGLEFDAVLICDADAVNYINEDDKKFLYIACTRALHRLSLFGEGAVSPYLTDS